MTVVLTDDDQDNNVDVVDFTPTAASDVWGLGCVLLQFLFEQPAWDLHSMARQFGVKEPIQALKLARTIFFRQF